MEVLISQSELTRLLEGLNINNYFVDIDMNGGLELNLPEKYISLFNKIDSSIKEIDYKRQVDDIYKIHEIYYPLKRIVIEEEDYVDEELKVRFQKRDFSNAYSQQLNSWLNTGHKNNNEDNLTTKPPRLTFYSYKGGVGRSTSLAIVARLLAKKGLKVAIIDLDLEAPGINSLLLTKPKSAPFGVVDYLYQAPWIRSNINQKRFISQYIIKEEVPRRNESPGQLFVMSAGGTTVNINSPTDFRQLSLLFEEKEVEIKLDPNYLRKLSYIDFDIYARTSSNVFEWLLEDVAKYTEADIILIDARTGISNISGAMINQYSDFLSIHIQNNRQNREGIEFLTKNFNFKKLDSIIWSNTKVPKGTTSNDEELRSFISNQFIEKSDMAYKKVNLHSMPFDNNLEDINAHELKEFIDYEERISLNSYKELTDQILSMTKLDKNLSSYISPEDRLKIINDLAYLLKQGDIAIPYISQRFLNEELKQFVGFPGSGKETFSNYMNHQCDEEVEILSYQEFIKQNGSIHHIISHVTFLDWNYNEASQAICKWFLQSPVLFEWLLNDIRLKKHKFVLEDFIAMKEKSEYELPAETTDQILNFIFSRNFPAIRNFKFIFNKFQYRNGYVLPKDLIQGVQLILLYLIEKERYKNTSGTDSLFRVPSSPRFFQKVLRPLIEEKKKWLTEIDENIINLIKAYGKVRHVETRENRYNFEFLEGKLKKELDFDEEKFNLLFKKSLEMEIFQKRKSLNNNGEMLIISPIYANIFENFFPNN